jgi:hypothetical protein
MIHTFKGLRDEVQRLLDEAGIDAAATTKALVKDFINQAHQQRCCEHNWTFMLWPHAETITTAAGVHIYPLHQEFHRPLYFWHHGIQKFVHEVPHRALPQGDYLTEPTGNAEHFSYWNTQPVLQQPPETSTVTLISDSASDVGTDYALVIKGETGVGSVIAELIVANGTTPVTTTNEFRTILGITKAGQWNGTLTLSDASGNVLVQLLNCELGRTYKTIWIHETVPGGEEISYRFYRQPLFLVNDFDLPELPPPHGQILVYDALVMMSAYLTDANPQTLAIWQMKQREAQDSLYQAYSNEGQTLDAEPVYVRYVPETWS